MKRNYCLTQKVTRLLLVSILPAFIVTQVQSPICFAEEHSGPSQLIEKLGSLKRLLEPGFRLDTEARANLEIEIENLQDIATALETFSSNLVKASGVVDLTGHRTLFSAYTNLVDRNRALERMIEDAERAAIKAKDYRLQVTFQPDKGSWLKAFVDKTNHVFTLKPGPGQIARHTIVLDQISIRPGRHTLNFTFEGPGSFGGHIELTKKDPTGQWQIVQVYDKRYVDGISPPAMEFWVLYDPPTPDQNHIH